MDSQTGVYVDPQDAQNNKVQGILAYIPLLFLVPLLAASESKFAKYHANQGLILTIVTGIMWLIQWLLTSLIIGINPISAVIGFGHVLITLITIVTWGAVVVFMVIGITNANKGECKPLPIVGNYHLLDK